MKGLSIEEKAKAYDSMFERLKEMYNNNKTNVAARLIYERYFPELKESEDERIRNWLICTLKSLNNSPVQIDGAYEMMLPAIAWLEKQGEQNLANSAKTCKDEQKPILDVEIPFGAKDSELQEVSYSIPNGYHAEIEGNNVIIKKGEQKPAWSEEDEKMFEHIIAKATLHFSSINYLDEEEINFLKSLKDRYTWKPKMEQLTVLSKAIELRPLCESDGTILMSLYYDLKKLTE